jgi:glycosyltransferase involved in cell wall biosynthesis
MKVLYSCLSRSWGGMEMYTITSLKQLLKRKVYVELLCIEGSRIHIEANELGLIINTVKSSRYLKLSGISRIAALIKRKNFDLIHSHYSKDLWQIVPALKILKSETPLILTKHLGSFVDKNDKLHAWIYGRLNAAIAISNVIKENLIATCPIEKEKVIVIPNGIDTDRFTPDKNKRELVRKEFGIDEHKIVIGMIARFSPGKGHEEFLTAAAELNKKYDNIIYIIVGEASRGEKYYEEKIKAMSGTLGLENIIFTGYRSDTETLLNGMDIFAFPSHAEAFGIALVEAMAVGIPAVCSNSDGVLDIAVDRITSYLFKNKDAEDLQIKIEHLINDPEERPKLGNAARKRVKEEFDINTITDRIMDFYSKLL